MKLKFWGTRGSLPRPLPYQEAKGLMLGTLKQCIDKDITTVAQLINSIEENKLSLPYYYGGDTTCIGVNTSEENTFFVDAGTGLRRAHPRTTKAKHFHILFTHVHWDHVMGLPFFEPLYQKENTFTFYHVHKDAPKYIELLFNGINFPVAWKDVPSQIEFKHIPAYEKKQIQDMQVTPFKLDHPGDAYGFRIESESKVAAICTDSSFERNTPEQLGEDRKYYQGLDLLVFDGQFDEQDYKDKFSYGHCTPRIGVEIAKRESIKKLVLTHHDPASTDHKIASLLESAREIAAGSEVVVEAAGDGMEIEV